MMPTLRIPLVGSFQNRLDGVNFTGDQVFTNCYPDITVNPVTGKPGLQLVKRLGTTVGSALANVDSACTSGGIVAWTSHTSTNPIPAAAFLVSGGTSTNVWNMAAGVKIGGDIPATDDCTCLTETVISSGSHIVGNFYDSSTHAIEQWYFPEGGAWTQVTSATLSTMVGFPAHMDGYVFNMTSDGKILNSDLNTVSTQSAANFISASQYPDKGITVARHGPHIVAFGERSIERFYNAGNATGSPLSRVQDGGLAMGAARIQTVGGIGKQTYQSVLPAKGTIYWIATNSEGAAVGVYRFKGTTPEKVSNVTVDRMIAGTQIFGFVGTASMHGMNHVLLKASNVQIAYCIETNFWWTFVLASGTVSGSIAASATNVGASVLTYFTTSQSARANVTPLGETASNHHDATSTYTMTVQTANMDLGTRRKKIWKAVSIVGDIQTTTSPLGISFSDDDYVSFSSSRTVDMSVRDNRLTRWGASRRRAWKLTHATTSPLRLEAIEFEYDLGAP